MDNANTLTDMAKVSLNKTIFTENQNIPCSLIQVNIESNRFLSACYIFAFIMTNVILKFHQKFTISFFCKRLAILGTKYAA